jgi:biotin carboxyl carrier protein
MSTFRVRVGSQVYHVHIQDVTAHPVIATIGDQQFEVWIQEQEGPAVSEPGAAPLPVPPIYTTPDPLAVAAQPRRQVAGGKTVRAPMPGQIVSIAVAAGDQVTRGDLLCVLEAMKMNNQIRAPQDGLIAEIQMTAGTQVNYGDPLIRFE